LIGCKSTCVFQSKSATDSTLRIPAKVIIDSGMGSRGGLWHKDEVLIKIQSILNYLWRAIGQDADTLDILI